MNNIYTILEKDSPGDFLYTKSNHRSSTSPPLTNHHIDMTDHHAEYKNIKKINHNNKNMNCVGSGDDIALNSPWTLWIHSNNDADWTIKSYKIIYEINNVGEMWKFLNAFPSLDKASYQYFVMRKNITPIWEDPDNKNGAICSIMIDTHSNNPHKLHSPNDAFISLCILILNESLIKNYQDINGISFSVKQKNILIKIWLKNYDANKLFDTKLPTSLINKISSMIDDETKSHCQSFTKSRISIKTKQIFTPPHPS